MSKDLARDQKFFNCSEEHEVKYVSGRFSDSEKVYAFLKSSCKSGKIKYFSHDKVYALIKTELGVEPSKK